MTNSRSFSTRKKTAISQFGLTRRWIDKLYPFSMIFNHADEIMFIGRLLQKVSPNLVKGVSIRSAFSIQHPPIPLTFKQILKHQGDMFMVRENSSSLALKGEMLFSKDQSACLFVCIPWITDIGMLERINLSVSEFPFYDVTVDVVFLLQSQNRMLEENRLLIENLKNSEAKYINLYNHAPELYATVHLNTASITNCNTTLAQTLGYKKTDVIGQPFLMLFPRNLQEEVIRTFESLKETGFIRDVIQQLQTKEGAIVDVNLSGTTLKDSDGTYHCRLSWRNVTTQRKIEREKEQLHMQLIQSAKLASLGELSAGIAHELNNPLFIITGFISRIKAILDNKSGASHDKIKEYIALIEEGALRMTHIIKYIKEFSRENDMALEKTNLNDIIQNAFTLYREQLRSMGIAITFALQPDALYVNCDPYRIEQVLVNLISNSKDALEARGTTACKELHISSTQSENMAIIKFSDNGIGIDQSQINRIFDPFVTSKGVGKGTGLGLSISKAIVEEHSGRISCESTLGEGTTITIKLPCCH